MRISEIFDHYGQGNKEYQTWIRACRKVAPDCQLSGSVQQAQMVDWSSVNNEVVGDWDGKKGVVYEPGSKGKKVKTVIEAVAAPFKKFKAGQKVRVKKTGQEVTVMNQTGIGLVFTATADATKVDPKQKVVYAKDYQEYMPSELELCESSDSKFGKVTLGERGSFNVDGKPVSYMHWDRFGKKKFFYYALANGERERVEIPDNVFITDIPEWVANVLRTVGKDIDTTRKSKF